LWALPLLTRIISGVGRIFMGQEFHESVVVFYWISRIPSPSTEAVKADANSSNPELGEGSVSAQ
jgi:hypothetical protein